MDRREFIRKASGGFVAGAVFGSAVRGNPIPSREPKQRTTDLSLVSSEHSLYAHNIENSLLRRTLRNYDRLETRPYQPDKVFRSDNYSWPGDWEGRTILALTLLSRVTDRTPRYLEKIMELFPKKMNEKGYLGEVYPEGTINEQQLSGHGWLLRGLCEYYQLHGKQQTLDQIERIVSNLALPLKGYIASYPITEEARGSDRESGEEMGSIQGKSGDWILSSDIGCAFIFLDGLTQANLLLEDPKLNSLIEEMITRYLDMDFIGVKAQTHATLTTLRAILRYYEQIGETSLLTAVQEIFELYKTEGMTANYANYNWFGRPEWTEPCAVIDSFIVAVSLWNHTRDSRYLEDTHHIYYNAILHGQRANGGFGTDTCAGAGTPFIKPRSSAFEAYWCCTMRGSESMARTVEFSHFVEDQAIYLPFYFNNQVRLRLRNGSITLTQQSDYPYSGECNITVSECTISTPLSFHLFLPGWLNNPTISLNGDGSSQKTEGDFAVVKRTWKPGDHIRLTGEMDLYVMDSFGKHNLNGYHTFRHGPCILGTQTEEEISLGKESALQYEGFGRYRIPDTNRRLTPLSNIINIRENDARDYQRQILFRSS